MIKDSDATEMEHAIAASAEFWHHRCVRTGKLYEQSVGETVLEALVRHRRLLEEAERRLGDQEDK